MPREKKKEAQDTFNDLLMNTRLALPTRIQGFSIFNPTMANLPLHKKSVQKIEPK